MTPQDFVSSLKAHCADAAVVGTLKNLRQPPGRKPDPELMRLSGWYKSLSSEDKANIDLILRDVAIETLFGVLCVIDGVRVIESQDEKSEFKLSASRCGEESVIAPNQEFLHDVLLDCLAEP